MRNGHFRVGDNDARLPFIFPDGSHLTAENGCLPFGPFWILVVSTHRPDDGKNVAYFRALIRTLVDIDVVTFDENDLGARVLLR